MSKQKNNRFLTLFLGLMCVLIGTFFQDNVFAVTKPLSKIGVINVAYVPHLGFSAIFIAQEKGYFSKQGLEVKLHRFRSGGQALIPLSVGHIDVSLGRIGTDLFNAFDKKMDLKIVAGGQTIDVSFIVRKDLFDTHKIRQPADLKGARMPAVSLHGLVEYIYAQVLGLGNLTIDDVKLVTLPFHEIPNAFANKAIDAGATAYPMVTKILDSQSGVKMPLKKLEPIQGEVMFFGQRLLKPAHQEIGIRFITAYLHALRDIQGENWKKDEHVAIYNQYVKFPSILIKRSPPPSFPIHAAINLKSIAQQQDYHLGRGYTEFKQPLPMTQMINPLFLKQAVKRLQQSSVEP